MNPHRLASGQRDVGGKVGNDKVRAEKRGDEVDGHLVLDQLAEDRIEFQQIEDSDIVLIRVEADVADRHAAPLTFLARTPEALAYGGGLCGRQRIGHDAPTVFTQMRLLGLHIHSVLPLYFRQDEAMTACVQPRAQSGRQDRPTMGRQRQARVVVTLRHKPTVAGQPGAGA